MWSTVLRILLWLLLYNNHHHLLRVQCLLGAVSDDLQTWALTFKRIFMISVSYQTLCRHRVKPFSQCDTGPPPFLHFQLVLTLLEYITVLEILHALLTSELALTCSDLALAVSSTHVFVQLPSSYKAELSPVTLLQWAVLWLLLVR